MKTEQTTLDRIRTRPRFKMYIHLNKEQYESNLKKFLKEHSDEFTGNVNKEVATISVKTEDFPYWKPQLSLRIEQEEEVQYVVRGIFGPSSSVWTFFMFLYFLWIVAWMTFFTLWFVGEQIKSQEFRWALPASFFILFLTILTYLSARYGQNKAKREMALLRRFAIESTLPHEKISTPDTL